MTVVANPARGEVAFSRAGQSFVLCATARAVAAIETQLGAAGLDDILARLRKASVVTIRTALMHLDVSAKGEDAQERLQAAAVKVEKLPLGAIVAAGGPIVDALTFGLKDEGADAKNAVAARETDA
jgi:hypothetical protein